MTLGRIVNVIAHFSDVECKVVLDVDGRWFRVEPKGQPLVVTEIAQAIRYEHDMAQIAALAKKYNIDAGRLEALVNGEKGHDAT